MSHEHVLKPALQSLRASLSELQQKRITTQAFCQAWRSQSALLGALPPRYGQVLEDLLGRMEAGSLFTEESCSFSQQDLLDSLQLWIDKAQLQLQKS